MLLAVEIRALAHLLMNGRALVGGLAIYGAFVLCLHAWLIVCRLSADVRG